METSFDVLSEDLQQNIFRRIEQPIDVISCMLLSKLCARVVEESVEVLGSVSLCSKKDLLAFSRFLRGCANVRSVNVFARPDYSTRVFLLNFEHCTVAVAHSLEKIVLRIPRLAQTELWRFASCFSPCSKLKRIALVVDRDTLPVSGPVWDGRWAPCERLSIQYKHGNMLTHFYSAASFGVGGLCQLTTYFRGVRKLTTNNLEVNVELVSPEMTEVISINAGIGRLRLACPHLTRLVAVSGLATFLAFKGEAASIDLMRIGPRTYVGLGKDNTVKVARLQVRYVDEQYWGTEMLGGLYVKELDLRRMTPSGAPMNRRLMEAVLSVIKDVTMTSRRVETMSMAGKTLDVFMVACEMMQKAAFFKDWVEGLHLVSILVKGTTPCGLDMIKKSMEKTKVTVVCIGLI
jgi:hypothetical protein